MRILQRIKDVEDPILLWQLDESFATRNQWIKGRVEIVAPDSIEEYRIEVQAVRGLNENGFIAVDDFTLADLCDICECMLIPNEANPPTTTTPAATTTTSSTEPTEPPDCKLLKLPFSHSHPSLINFLDDFLCDFEADKCQWQITTTDPENAYKWTRTTAHDLSGSDAPSPEGDCLSCTPDGYFMIASDYLASDKTPQTADTEFKSPLFNGEQHPIICLSFWFYFGVRRFRIRFDPRCYISNLFQTEGNGETLAIIYAKEGDEGDNKVVWMLEDTIENDEKEWYEGRVEIHATNYTIDHQYKVSLFRSQSALGGYLFIHTVLLDQIVLMASKGHTDQSFVAIDQLEFKHTDQCEFMPSEAWPTSTTTTSTTAKPEHWLECTFEQGFCQWELSGAITDEMFYWNRTNGQELVANDLLGPTLDHNGNQKGEIE